ncbi:apolipoprotein N-acyltransferase [Neptunomonas japonica]|uniref:apolipoprotein N-acyltransferase n=1 Tax=Neptunomonas japonica TaxID=417574 RepID=UPI0003F5B1A5|nr:apolipoprotein N-acyltransferase [Neptunomonas japonica]
MTLLFNNPIKKCSLLKSITGVLVSLAAGVILPLAFAPYEFYFFAPLSLAILFFLWRLSTPRIAALRGGVFGIGAFSSGLYWLFETFHKFALVPAPTAFVALLLFILYLSLFPALCGYLVNRFGPKNDFSRLLLIYPSVWTLLEWARGEWPVDFPWLQIGYAAINTPVSSLAPIGGVFLVSWVTALVAGIICYGVVANKNRFFISTSSAFLIYTALSLLETGWVKPAGKPIEIAIIQGNTPQNIKWNPEYRSIILENYQSITLKTIKDHKYDVVIWPETAIPAYREELEDTFLKDIKDLMKVADAELLTGISDFNYANYADYNSAMVISDKPAIYHKRRLVPFGEYIPLRPILSPVLALFGYNKRDYQRGNTVPVLKLANTFSGVSICYEILFGERIRESLPKSTWLVNITNDAWFGNTTAPYQHFQMARMRAKESGRMLVRAANTGLSGVIDSDGQVLQQSDLNEKVVITSKVYPMKGVTPWIKYGDKPVLVFLLVVLLCCTGWYQWLKVRINGNRT